MTRKYPQERAAIVTDAVPERGIGRATSRRLAREGWSIGILGLDEEAAGRTADELAEEFSVETFGVGADLADEAAVRAAIDRLEYALPQIVGLANIADSDLAAAQHISKRVAETLVDNEIGRLVNVASASAAAQVFELTVALARELGEYDVTVNAVVSGLGDAGPPDDIAAAIAFLLGREAGLITGQAITVDGGLSLTTHH